MENIDKPLSSYASLDPWLSSMFMIDWSAVICLIPRPFVFLEDHLQPMNYIRCGGPLRCRPVVMKNQGHGKKRTPTLHIKHCALL